MSLIWTSCSISETAMIAKELLAYLEKYRVVTLQGNLGSGKTTLAQWMIRSLANDPHLGVPSPTFTYVHEYEAKTKIYHFDLYRIESQSQLVALGLHEMLEDPLSISIIEWPQIALPFIPQDHMQVHIEQTSKQGRKITLSL